MTFDINEMDLLERKLVAFGREEERKRIIHFLIGKRKPIPPEGEDDQAIINAALKKIIEELNDVNRDLND